MGSLLVESLLGFSVLNVDSPSAETVRKLALVGNDNLDGCPLSAWRGAAAAGGGPVAARERRAVTAWDGATYGRAGRRRSSAIPACRDVVADSSSRPARRARRPGAPGPAGRAEQAAPRACHQQRQRQAATRQTASCEAAHSAADRSGDGALLTREGTACSGAVAIAGRAALLHEVSLSGHVCSARAGALHRARADTYCIACGSARRSGASSLWALALWSVRELCRVARCVMLVLEARSHWGPIRASARRVHILIWDSI